MRSSEWLSFGYFAVMTAAAWARPLPMRRRVQISVVGIPACVLVFVLARVGSNFVRDWAPPLAILAGYYLSGRFFVHPSVPFESWLMAGDRRWLGDPATRFARWPRPILVYLEVVYMGCFLLVPAGFLLLAMTGRAFLADRYWTMVLAAEYAAFAPLAIVPTRPPWALEKKPDLTGRTVHRAAEKMVHHLTIRANTFPSGHVAGSLAVAFAVIGAMPWAGAMLLGLALSISVACVVGRYHYVVDVVAGAALAVAIWAGVVAAGL